MDKNRPLILITNDDGYAAKGLRKLVTLMRTLGDVVLISTDEVMSAKSHSCTIRDRLYVRLVQQEEGFTEYRCNGTPVDCVKLAYQKLCERQPDLVVSGINHGMNAATTVVYSGTIGAVIEASMNGLTAIGYSLFSLDPDADFDHLDTAILEITKTKSLLKASRCADRRPVAGWNCSRTSLTKTVSSSMTSKAPSRATTSCPTPTSGHCNIIMPHWCPPVSIGLRMRRLNR